MDTYSIAFSLPRHGSLFPSSAPSRRSDTRSGLGQGAFMPGKDDGALVYDPSLLPGASGSLSENYKRNLRAYLDHLDNGASCHVKVAQEKRGAEPRSALQNFEIADESIYHGLPGGFNEGACLSFFLSGSDRDAREARNTVYRHFPRPARYTLHCSPTQVIKKTPRAGGGFTLEHAARKRIVAIATATRAEISILNHGPKDDSVTLVETIEPGPNLPSPNRSSATSSPGSASTSSEIANGSSSSGERQAKAEWLRFKYGQEECRTCRLDITGTLESVERAKVRLLVMLDELHGLVSQSVEINYKLHNLIAGRLRKEVDCIQKATGTNIYFPTPLVGVFDAPLPNAQSRSSSSPSTSQGQLSIHSTGHVANGDTQFGGHSQIQYDQYGHSRDPHQNHGPPFDSYHHYGTYPHVALHPGLHPPQPRLAPYQYYGHGPMPPGGLSVAPVLHMPNNVYQNNPGVHGFHGQPGHHRQFTPNSTHSTHNTLDTGADSGMVYQGATHMHVGLPGGFMGGHPNADPFGVDTDVHRGEQGETGPAMEVWITGDFFGVQRARDLLQEKEMIKESMIIHRSMAVHPFKNDWLLTEHLHKLRAMMLENGTYIQMPVVGSPSTTVVVFGDHPLPVLRTLRQIANLTCHYSEASVSLVPAGFDPVMPPSTIMPSQVEPILKRVAHESGAQVIFRNNVFQAHGLECEVKKAVSLILATDLVKTYKTNVEFNLEIDKAHKDFVEGKKRGKLNKIVRDTGAHFDEFSTVNDFNHQVRIYGRGSKVLDALGQLEAELPAEITFHVPDLNHRRIIGLTGAPLRVIMEKHNVFVRFHDRSELDPEGGLSNIEDNCLILTPTKLADGLEAAKNDVNEQCLQDSHFGYERVKIPRQYHRNLVGGQASSIEGIQQRTQCAIRFPPKELGSDVTLIFGPKDRALETIAWLQEVVPFEAEFALPHSQQLVDLVASEDFTALVKRIKDEDHIDLFTPSRPSHNQGMVFKLQCQLRAVESVVEARKKLEEFVKARGIEIESSDAESFSFVDHFAAFADNLDLARLPLGRARNGAPVSPRNQNVKAPFDNTNGPIGSRGPMGNYPTVHQNGHRGGFGAGYHQQNGHHRGGGFSAGHQPNGHPRGGFSGGGGQQLAAHHRGGFGGAVGAQGPWSGAGGGFGRGAFHDNPNPTPQPNHNAGVGFGVFGSTFNGFGDTRPPPVTPPAGYSLNLDGSASPWATTTPAARAVSAATAAPPTATQSLSVTTPSQQVSLLEGTSSTGSSKRESDPLLADRARAAQSHSARSLSARTQSLDITSLTFRRAVGDSGTGTGPIGTGSTASGGATASNGFGGGPNTASASYFPGHRVRGSLSRPLSSSFDARIDDLSRTMGVAHISHPSK